MFDIFDPFYLQKQHEAQQQAAAQLAGQGGTGDLYNSMAPEQHQSFLDRAYESSLGGLDYIGKVLDKTFGGRAIRGLLGGKPQEALSVIPFSDTLGITDPNNIIHGKDLLDNVGLTTPGQESFLGTLAGTATEMALDPSTYLGIGPATAAGKAAIKAGTATKGLAAGIRAGERGLIGFGLPFGESKLLLGTGQGGAAIAEGIPKALGAAAYAPVQAATYAAKPFEWLTGVNPVTKAYDAASSLAGGLGRAINTHFNPDVAGATTSIGQDIGANVFTPAVKDYKVPLNQARAAAIEELNPILQRGPQAERALFEGMQLAMERPKDPTAFAPNVLREYQQTVGELGQKLSQGEIGQAAFDAGEQAARGQRDDMLARLAQNEKFFATRTPESAWAKGGLTPEEMQLAQKHAGVFSDLNAQMLADEAAKGLNTNSLDDIIGYSTRQLQSMPKAEGEGLWNYLGRRNREGSAAFDVTQKAREDVFRNVPGGTTAIDELIRDPNLRKMAPDQLEAALNAHLTGNATPPGHFPAVNQARELADLIQTRDPRYATDQLDYFKKNIFDTLGMKGEAHARKMAMADSVLASISDKTAKPAADFLAANRASLPVTEVLDKAGFKQGGPGYQQVISGLGLTNGKDLKGLHVPEDVAADVMRLGEAWKTPAALAPVVQAWDTMMNSFKTSVTAAFPAFHTRNVMSGIFNMWRDSALSLDAMKEAQAIQRGGLMTDTMAAKLFPGKTAEEATSLFKQELLANNVAYTRQTRGVGADVLGPTDRLTNYSVPLTTGTQKPLKDIATDYVKGFLPTAEAKKAGYSSAQQLLNPFLTEGVGADANIFRPVAQGRAVGEAAEDWMRSAHYMAKREAGFAPDVAAESVAKYHIDYSNLTQTEKQVMKRLVPWYSFSRRNLPPVLEDLVTQPAKVAQTVRAVAGTRDNNQWAPSYIAEGASLPLPGAPEGTNRYLSSFGLPVEDEAVKLLGNALSGNLKRTFQSALGMGSPILKAPYEQAFDQQLFSGRRLSDLDPSPTVSLGGLIPDRAAQVLTQLVSNTPAARLVSTIDRATDTRKWDGTLIPNLLTGLKVSDVDLAKAKPAAEREFLQDALRPAPQTKTREEVYVPANKKGTLSPEDQLLLDLLTGLNADQQKAARQRKTAGR